MTEESGDNGNREGENEARPPEEDPAQEGEETGDGDDET
jgi:hypothetical protein